MIQFINYINDHVINLLSDFLLPIASVIVVGMIIWGGFKYIQGDAENGKKTITAAIIGLVIIALSSLIINSVNNIISGNLEYIALTAIEGDGGDSNESPIGEGSPFGEKSSPNEDPPVLGGEIPTG